MASLEPGEELSWHTDNCESFTVVVRGDRLAIEYRETGETVDVAVHPGMTGWTPPEPRVHRATNTGASAYEEVATLYLGTPGSDPQPGG